MRERYWANREAAREYSRAYHRANAEAAVERSRQWRLANPERHAALLRAHYLANRERYNDSGRARRVRHRDAFVEHVDSLVVLERADGECGVCGGDVDPSSFHVDHIIPLSRGGEHSYANTQPAHAGCNLSKGASL
jgi:5-methylcytosine-specific restriction endonuclease McrA